MELQTKVIILGTPLVVREKEVLELTMREPLVEDMLEAAELAGDLATTARLEVCTFAYLCDVPLADIMRMRQADWIQVQRAYSFLTSPVPPRPKTSEEPSLSSESGQDGDEKK